MNDTNIYTTLWEKYKHAIVAKLKLSVDEPQTYKMTKQEFESIGERKKASYAFNLEIKNGFVINNSKGTANARDLFKVLQSSNFAKEFLQNKHVKISLTKSFMLSIIVLNQPATTDTTDEVATDANVEETSPEM